MPDPSQIPKLKGPTAEEIKRDNDKALADKKAAEVYKKSEESISPLLWLPKTRRVKGAAE